MGDTIFPGDAEPTEEYQFHVLINILSCQREKLFGRNESWDCSTPPGVIFTFSHRRLRPDIRM